MPTSLRVIFAGTPTFSATILSALLHSSHEVIAVYTQPDAKQGRGLKTTFSPVKELALQHHLLIHQPEHFKSTEEHTILRELNADVMIVAAYGLLLPKIILETPRYGCINIHTSLLPRWRGAAPIQRSIHAGDAITGTSIMQMDEGLDTGDILFQETYSMRPDETSASLHDELAKQGANGLLKTLSRIPIPAEKRIKQDDQLATYAKKLTKEEAIINWNIPAKILDQHIRAYNPWPVAHTTWQGQLLKIWRAEPLTQHHTQPAGTILHVDAHQLHIATQDGALSLLEVQLAGGKRLSIQDFLNSKRHLLQLNERFSS